MLIVPNLTPYHLEIGDTLEMVDKINGALDAVEEYLGGVDDINTSIAAAEQAVSDSQAAQAAAEAAYDSFDDRYLGAKTSDPTLDNDGNALITGALYFNSTLADMRVWTGTLWASATRYLPVPINDIGSPGGQGFGVGICPHQLPAGISELLGTTNPASDNYGNYQYVDGSIMVWIPAFYYKLGTGSNGVAVNDLLVAAFADYQTVAAANADGYALHRAFYDGGAVKTGVFVDKYLCSNNAGTASSIALGNPLSSNAAHNPFNGLTGAPANNYGGAIAAAKTRGAGFFCSSLFIFKALALLSLAHARASSATTYCAWYDATNNFPKGCNNNALGDAQDGALTFVSDGYSNAAKTGSANVLAKTAHNGQNCGVVDLNGCMWEITPGLAMDSSDHTVGNFYVLSTSVAMKNVTGGNSLSTDLWGATGYAAMYDNLGLMNAFGGYALNFTDRNLTMGNASQVLSEAVAGTAWAMTGAGVPLLSGGSNLFGNDGLYDYSTNEMCPLCGGRWNSASTAGVWALRLNIARSASSDVVGFRAALYL